MRIATKDILGYYNAKKVRLYNTETQKMEYIQIKDLKEKLQEDENYCNLKYDINTDSLKFTPIGIKGRYIKLSKNQCIYIGENLILCWENKKVTYVRAKLEEILYIDTINGLKLRLENNKEVHIDEEYIWYLTEDSGEGDLNIDKYFEFRYFRNFELDDFISNNIKLELLADSILN